MVCGRIVDGLSLREIAKELGCDVSSIGHWIAEDEAFAQQYARAKTIQMETMAAELLEIADDASNDWMVRAGEAGELVTVPDHEHIQRSRLRVDTRKWLMSKLAPKRYGEKITQEHTGAEGGPIVVVSGVPRADE